MGSMVFPPSGERNIPLSMDVTGKFPLYDEHINKTESKETIIMKRVMLFSLTCMISLAIQPFPASGTALFPTQAGQTSSSVETQGELRASYGALPLSFERNQGQTDGEVDFLARARKSTSPSV